MTLMKKINETNKEIRAALSASGIKQWQLADRIGIPETSLCKLLRYELPKEKKEEILDIIGDMIAEREHIA